MSETKACGACKKDSCCANPSRCGKCCGGCCQGEIILAPEEISMLTRFAEVPFLPVARRKDSRSPIFLEDADKTAEEYGVILYSLNRKGLISLDYNVPLSNFDYSSYTAYPIHGSMALTARGQAAVDLIEIQGVN